LSRRPEGTKNYGGSPGKNGKFAAKIGKKVKFQNIKIFEKQTKFPEHFFP